MRSTAVLVAVVGLAAIGRGDDPKKPAIPEPSPAQMAFAEAVSAAQKALREANAYTVAVDGKWKLTGGKKEQAGTQTVRVMAANPDKLRIEFGMPDDHSPHLVITCDGKTITRSFTEAKLYSVTPYSGTPLDHLQSDGVTVSALRTVAVDFLARPNMLAVLTSQALSVADLGVKDDRGRKTHGFQLGLVGGKVMTVRFAVGERPVPVEVSSTLDIAAGEKKTYTRTLNVTLAWDWSAQLPAEAFTTELPHGAKQVDDLLEAVLAPELDDVLGKTAPDVEFAGLDGKPVKLRDYAGRSVVVLYAWATWAAPEGKNLPVLNEFVKAYSGKGVTFVAVNVGDTPQAVQQFAEAAKYTGVVALDPRGAGLSAVRVSSVPAVVVIGKDGTVQSFHRGKPDTADKVKADLDKLLRGESLAPKK